MFIDHLTYVSCGFGTVYRPFILYAFLHLSFSGAACFYAFSRSTTAVQTAVIAPRPPAANPPPHVCRSAITRSACYPQATLPLHAVISIHLYLAYHSRSQVSSFLGLACGCLIYLSHNNCKKGQKLRLTCFDWLIVFFRQLP